jgi:LPPG:FO 2-phospho-L-lactate transferase
MYQEMGLTPSALTVARHYGTLLSGFVMDHQDADADPAIQALGLKTLVTDTIMRGRPGRKRLAEEILHWLGGER